MSGTFFASWVSIPIIGLLPFNLSFNILFNAYKIFDFFCPKGRDGYSWCKKRSRHKNNGPWSSIWSFLIHWRRSGRKRWRPRGKLTLFWWRWFGPVCARIWTGLFYMFYLAIHDLACGHWWGLHDFLFICQIWAEMTSFWRKNCVKSAIRTTSGFDKWPNGKKRQDFYRNMKTWSPREWARASSHTLRKSYESLVLAQC